MILLQIEWSCPAFQPDFWQPSSSVLISFPAPSVEILFDYLILRFPGLEHLGHYFSRQMEPSFSPSVSNMTFYSSGYTGMRMINAILIGGKEAKQKISANVVQHSSLLPVHSHSDPVGFCSPSQLGGGQKNGVSCICSGLRREFHSSSSLKSVVRAGARCNPQGVEM